MITKHVNMKVQYDDMQQLFIADILEFYKQFNLMMAKLYHIDEFETYEAGEHGRGKSGLGKSMGASK